MKKTLPTIYRLVDSGPARYMEQSIKALGRFSNLVRRTLCTYFEKGRSPQQFDASTVYWTHAGLFEENWRVRRPKSRMPLWHGKKGFDIEHAC